LRGVRYRAGRSLVVLLLATVAATAAAAIPGYARAAQESVVRDLVAAAPAVNTSLRIQAPTSRNAPGTPRELGLNEANSLVTTMMQERPLLRSVVSGKASHADTYLMLADQRAGTIVTGRLVYREGVCDHVEVTGRCPSAPNEVMVSARTAQAHGIKADQDLGLTLGPVADQSSSYATANRQPQQPTVKPKVVGVYTPKEPRSEYWGLNGLLAFGDVPEIHMSGTLWTIDAVLAGALPDVQSVPDTTVRKSIAYWFDLDGIGVSNLDALHSELVSVMGELNTNRLNVASGLPGFITDVRSDQAEIASTIPLGAVPLLVLALAVLMVLVASLTEERGPEIGLAKLHGYGRGRISSFGLGEVLFLITLAAPLGLLTSFAALYAISRFWLAPGVPYVITWQPFAAVGIALVVTYVSAFLASRQVFGTRIINLLRRVPQRVSWRAGAFEGAAAALAIAAIVTVVQDRSSGLGVLVAPLVAIVLGVAGGRLISISAAARVRRARKKADLAALLSGAALARRPGRQRIVIVVAVATALMGFSATAWDVAQQARDENANGMLGAATIYRVSAPGPQQLISAVNKAAPDGSAMAVLRRSEYYGGGQVEVLGVQSERLASTATWYRHTSADLAAAASKLKPPTPPPYLVEGPVTVRLETTGFAEAPMGLALELVTEAGEQVRAELGVLKTGTHEYTGTVPAARIKTVLLIRRPGDPQSSGQVLLQSITSAKGSLPVGDVEHWQPVVAAGTTATLDGGPALRARITASSNGDIRLTRIRAPKALPVLLTGPVPAPKAGNEWTFMAFGGQPQAFTVAATEPAIPGAHGHGILVDLEYGLTQAEDISAVGFDSVYQEVWAGPGAPAGLSQRLEDQGLQIVQTQTLAGYSDQLARRAPALALRLHLLAAIIALLLGLGIVLLAARIGSGDRRYEFAALRITGVPSKVLRAGIRREYLTLLAWPSLGGFAAGVASAVLMLPAIPLVTAGVVTESRWQPAPGVLAAAVAACLACLLIALPVVTGLVRTATPDLVRGEG
jgi:putative ABC transport system permease protein